MNVYFCMCIYLYTLNPEAPKTKISKHEPTSSPKASSPKVAEVVDLDTIDVRSLPKGSKHLITTYSPKS